MISLMILLAIWGVYSLINIYLYNSKRGTPFDISDAPSFFTYAGAIVFIALMVGLIIYTCINYLP